MSLLQIKAARKQESGLKKMSEYDEQVIIFQWARMSEARYPELWLLNASLMGVNLGFKQASKAKKSGVKRGFPDISLPVPRGTFHGLYIELKYGKNTATKEQIEWLQRLRDQGYRCGICKGSMEAIDLIKKYLNT